MLYTEILNEVQLAFSRSQNESWGAYLTVEEPGILRDETSDWVLIPNPEDPANPRADTWFLQRSIDVKLTAESENAYAGSTRSVRFQLSAKNNGFNRRLPTLTRETDSVLSKRGFQRRNPTDMISTGSLFVEEKRQSGLSIMDQVTISGSGSSIETGIQCQGRLPRSVITTPSNDVDIVIDGTGKHQPVKELTKGYFAGSRAERPTITISYSPKRESNPLPEGIEEVYQQAEASAEDEMDGMINVNIEDNFPRLITSANTMIWKEEESDGTIVVYFHQEDGILHCLEVTPSCAVAPIEDYMNKIFKGHDANLFDGITISSNSQPGDYEIAEEEF